MEGVETSLGELTLELEKETSGVESPIPGQIAEADLLLDPGGLEEEAVELPPGSARPRLAQEAAHSVAIEENLRALLAEIIDFDLAFQQLMRVGKQLSRGEVRLRSVIDVSASFEGASNDDADPQDPEGSGAAMQRTLTAFKRLARLRQGYLRLSKSPGSAGVAAARRRELVRSIEGLSIHPGQLRRIDDGLETVLNALGHAEQNLLDELRAAGRGVGNRPRSLRGWRLAIREVGDPQCATRARLSLEVLSQLEAEAGEPLARLREGALAVRRAHLRFETAKSQMVSAHLGMVRAVASRYAHQGLDPTDLLQEGSIGLMRAVERFDHRRGFRFSTYAHWWIRQAITRAIADQGRTVRVPVHMNEQLTRLRRVSSYLSQRLGRPPTLEEVAEAANVSPEKATATLRYHRQAVSLDAPLGADGDASLLDLVADPNAADPTSGAEEAELKQRLEGALCGLPPREQEVLRLRFGIGQSQLGSLEEIGQVMGVTRERVRQIEFKALRRLQRRGRGLDLRAFLP